MAPIQKKHWAGLAAGFGLMTVGIVALIKNKKPSPQPVGESDIVVSDLSILPQGVFPGETVNVQVRAHNTGTEAGSVTITVNFANQPMGQMDVTLQPNQSQVLVFKIEAPDVPGAMQVNVEGLQGFFLIKNPNPETISASGRIYDAHTGQPVEGATVSIEAISGAPLEQHAVETDASGSYRINDIIVPGVYQFAVSANGYEVFKVNIQLTDTVDIERDADITPIIAVPTKLVLSAKNLPSALWGGYIKDLSTRAKQSWGTRNGQEPVTLNPITGSQVLVWYEVLDPDMHIIGNYYFLATLPSSAGIVTWDASLPGFQGADVATNLVEQNNNYQLIRGRVQEQFSDNQIMTIQITESISYSGYPNVGQYLIGEIITLHWSPPLAGNNFALAGGDLVEFDGKMELIPFSVPWGQVSLPEWTSTFFRRARAFPDSAYSFSGDVTYDTVSREHPDYGSITPITAVNINSLYGSAPNFRTVIVALGSQNGYARNFPIAYFNGPISGLKYTLNLPNGMDGPPDIVIASHPNPNQTVPSYGPLDLDSWQVISHRGFFG